MAGSASGQAAGFSIRKQGFDSPTRCCAAVVNSADTPVFQTGTVGSMPTGRSGTDTMPCYPNWHEGAGSNPVW